MDPKRYVIAFFLLFLFFRLPAQSPAPRHFLEPADTLDRKRFWMATGTGTLLYGAASVGLWHSWYKGYELSGFHTFNDVGEWENMDKFGHAFSAHMEAYLIFKGARWTGMPHRSAAWTGAGGAMLLQTTIEVMDGFSSKWGFSWSDMAFNAVGAGLFLSQELLWQEQRIWMKVSNTRPSYSTTPVYASYGTGISSLQQRAYELYGESFAEAFLKDYNGQTIWLSVNPSSFIVPRRPGSHFPKWLNIAFGYGAQNMYGGIANLWWDDNGNQFIYDETLQPRYRQFYLSLDVDLTRIKTKSRVLKTLFTIFNWIKIPAPTLEVNTRGGVIFHPVYW